MRWRWQGDGWLGGARRCGSEGSVTGGACYTVGRRTIHDEGGRWRSRLSMCMQARDGNLYVGSSQVTLDPVIIPWQMKRTPEEIQAGLPAVPPADLGSQRAE